MLNNVGTITSTMYFNEAIELFDLTFIIIMLHGVIDLVRLYWDCKNWRFLILATLTLIHQIAKPTIYNNYVARSSCILLNFRELTLLFILVVFLSY